MLSVYTIDQSIEWDELVRSFINYDVYYLSGYVKAFKIHGDGDPYLFYFNGSSVRGINVVMKRDLSKDTRFNDKIEQNTLFDLITPYGYGGWLIEGNGELSELFDSYQSWCLIHNVVSEFVRYHPVLENHKYSEGFYDVLPLGSTIIMDLSSQKAIWNNLTSKNRNMVRKAQKLGIVVYNGRYPEIFEKFRDIYIRTMNKDDAKAYYYFNSEFFLSVMMDLPQAAQVFYAELNGEVIAASIILATNGRLNYHLSGSLQEYQNLAPTNLLLYTVALWGCHNGCRTLHLGGGIGSNEDNLYKFKKAFNRNEPCKFYIGQKVYMDREYQELIGLRSQGEIENSRFFPKYRA